METAGLPSLNASKPQEPDEPSMKDVMGVLSALARDVSELKGKRPSSPSPDGPQRPGIHDGDILLGQDKATHANDVTAINACNGGSLDEVLEEKAGEAGS